MVRSVYKSVTTNYGEVVVTLGEILKEQGVTRTALAKAVGARYETIDKWCNGTVERIDADLLARICYALDCDLTKIIKYVAIDDK